MKSYGRAKLYCWKKLRCGVIDHFYVVVRFADKEDTKKKYKDMGYEVIEA